MHTLECLVVIFTNALENLCKFNALRFKRIELRYNVQTEMVGRLVGRSLVVLQYDDIFALIFVL